jgi:hypothetical protein
MLFYRAALPLSPKTLTFVSGVIRRHRVSIGSPWRKAVALLAVRAPKLSPRETPRTGRARERPAQELAHPPLRCCPWRAGQLAKPSTYCRFAR